MEPRVTQVRHDAGAGRALLDAYLFGGIYGPVRVPRGIAPEVVLEFVREHVAADAEPRVFGKCRELLRFYELAEALPVVVRALEHLHDGQDVRRSAFVLQTVGDLGAPADADRAAAHFDTRLVPFPEARLAFPALLDTRLALAPHGSDAALAARIHVEVQRAQADAQRDEQAMMLADGLSAVERNELPRTRALSAAKTKLGGLKGTERIQAMVDTYLGRTAAGGPYLETWAARMLRRAVFADGLALAVEALGRAIDAAEPRQEGTVADVVIVRAAQAILYLGGVLLPAWEEAYLGSLPTGAGMNFLWDDP